MSLLQQAKDKPFHFAGLVAGLVLLTQFNTGFKLLYSKWTADEKAEAAEKIAVEAKGTAEGVDDRFDRYIQQQEQAIETQNKIAEAIAGYTQQQQAPQQVYRQMPDYPQPNTFIEGPDNEGLFWCCRAYDYEQCFEQDQDGYDLWMQCDPKTMGM